jgi:hypothetical protein
LVSQEGKTVFFDQKLAIFSEIIEHNEIDDVIRVDIPEAILKTIQGFLESHQYSANSMRFSKPIKSNKIEDNLDSISADYFKDFNTLNKMEEIKNIMHATIYLNIEPLKNILYNIIACQFYIGET